MANRHFGKIGDVWKHLALAEILAGENPRAYWESHAGSALYPLTHSMARDYGVFRFFAKAPMSAQLGGSAYYGILRQIERDGQLRMYPGSPLIAMQLLASADVDFLFCDLDADSLASVRNAARELHLPAERVRICQTDGIVTLNGALADLTPEQAGRTFAHLDPYLPLAAADHGLDSAELFSRLTLAGVKVMFWYGFASHDEAAELQRRFSSSLAANEVDGTAHLWRGEIILKAMGDPDFDINPGVMGCGVLCSNLSMGTIQKCTGLGDELARIYADARFPGGYDGALVFRHASG